MEEKIITLNGENFYINSEVTLNNTNYIYASNDDVTKIAILKETNENGEIYVESVSNEEELKMVMRAIAVENN